MQAGWGLLAKITLCKNEGYTSDKKKARGRTGLSYCGPGDFTLPGPGADPRLGGGSGLRLVWYGENQKLCPVLYSVFFA
jgi:hypothetical protein